MLLDQMPASGSDKQSGGLFGEPIALAVRTGKWDGAVDGVSQIDRTLKVILPGGRVGVLEVGHENVGPRIEGVDNHLPIDRPGDLDSSVLQIAQERRYGPRALSNLTRRDEKIGEPSCGEFMLTHSPLLQNFLSTSLELSVEL